jgi:hypothetical protein
MFLIRSNWPLFRLAAVMNPEPIVWIIAKFPLIFNPQITPVTPVATRQSPSAEKPAINARQMNPPMRLWRIHPVGGLGAEQI